MGISDRLVDSNYIPEITGTSANDFDFVKVIKCPVTFTDDPIEYAEGYLKYKLKPIQRNILIDLFSTDAEGQSIYNHAVFIAGMRCLGLGTEVLMYDGSVKKVEDIVVGDVLMGPDGTSRNVLSTTTGKSMLYRVRQSHGMDYIVNSAHVLSLKREKDERVINISIGSYLKKFRRWKKSHKGYKGSFIEIALLSSIKVSIAGIGDYAGFTVDGDNLFCLSDGTVTHNSGKSILGGLSGSFLMQKLLAMDDPGTALGQVPGQKFVAEYIATSEQQSKQTAFAAFMNIINNTDWWRKYIAYLRERELKEGKGTLFDMLQRSVLFPSKNLEAHSLHSNSQSLAGFTAFFVCFDEMSRFDVSDTAVQQQSEKRSAQAVYFTAARAAKTLSGFSKILTITSPMYETDFGMQLLYMSKEVKAGPSTKRMIDALRTRYTDRVDDIIGYHYCTYEANPKTQEDPHGYTEKSFDAEKKANYSAFMRDYMAVPPAAISPFFELPERIEKSVYHGREPLVIFNDDIIQRAVGDEVRRYMGKRIQVVNTNKIQKYFICCDQGAVKDSFVVAMGHGEISEIDLPDARGKTVKTERHKVVIDFVEAWKPNKEDRITVSFENVEDVIKVLNSCFYIDRVVYDQWHSTESIERLFSEGIMTSKLGADLEMYETFKILLYSGMIDLPDNDTLLTELRQLSVIKNKKIDHPQAGSKDIADAVARVVWCVYLDSIRDAVHGKFMHPMGQPIATIRSVATAAEIMKDDMYNEVPNYGIFGSTSNGKSVFGKSTIVQCNVVPNIGDRKFK